MNNNINDISDNISIVNNNMNKINDKFESVQAENAASREELLTRIAARPRAYQEQPLRH
jgi:hypothetical protein